MDMYGVLVRREDRKEYKFIINFFQETFLLYTKAFTLNFSNVLVSFYLIDEMLTGNSYIYLYKGISALAFLGR